MSLTHTQQQTLVLLDGTQTSQEACHHDDGAQGDDEVGGRERREGRRQRRKVALGDREPDSDTQQATPT